MLRICGGAAFGTTFCNSAVLAAEGAVMNINDTARTGSIDDGGIFVTNLADVIRRRTGQSSVETN